MRGCLAVLLALAFSVAVVPLVAASDDIQVRARRQGDTFDVEATAQVPAGLQVTWDVLTDYDRLSEFIPGMYWSRIVSRDGNQVQVDQRGEARLLFFSFPIEVRLAIEETPRERIASHAVSGNFRELRGEYRLESQGGETRLYYAGSFTPAFDIPPLIGTMVVRHTLEQRFAAMVREIRRRQAAADRQGVPDSGS